MSEPRPLHRLFGLSWIDFFQGTPVAVETELDLSLRQQFIDLVLIRKGPGPLPRPLPDGFEDLAAHNLGTFKSHQEALGAVGAGRPLRQLPEAGEPVPARAAPGG